MSIMLRERIEIPYGSKTLIARPRALVDTREGDEGKNSYVMGRPIHRAHRAIYVQLRRVASASKKNRQRLL